MLLHAEIDQLVILNFTIVILVVPEDVFDEIMDFVRVLVHDCYQKFTYFVFLKLLVAVFVELNALDIDQLSHLEGQVVRRKLEFVVFS